MNDTTSPNPSGAIFLDMTNPVIREGVQFAAVVSALRFEVKTGMKMTHGTLAAANRIMGTAHRTKKAALAEAEKRQAAHKEANGIG